jgi:hypothetical protein
MGSFSLTHWLIVGVIVWGLWRLVSRYLPGASRSLVCTTCGHHGPSKSRVRGSFLIEIVLWLCFIVPGLVYSLWRLSTRGHVCAACGATTLVPADSPVGRKLLDAQEAPRPE